MAMTSYHPGLLDHFGKLDYLAHVAMTCFEQTGQINNLKQSITLHRAALAQCSHGHPDRSYSLNNLVIAVTSCFQQTGQINDVEEPVALLHEALTLCPPGHPDHFMLLNNLANALGIRFEQTGQINDLQESVALLHEALALFPPGHSDHSYSLNNLATAAMSRFEQTGQIDDLEESVALNRGALVLRPPGHPGRSGSLNDLAHAVNARFEQTGQIGDLEESVALLREALVLCPPGHPGCSKSLSSLANAVSTHFQQTGQIDDLKEVVVLNREALVLRPPGHPGRSSSLNNLANAVWSHFKQTGQINDLQESVVLHREALILHPPRHRERSMSLNNLAATVNTRFDQTCQIDNLEEPVALLREALLLSPPGHPDRSMSLNNLANAVGTRFKWTGQIDDLEETVVLHHEALRLHAPGRPDRSGVLANLVGAMLTCFKQTGKNDDLEEALYLFELCADDHVSSVQTRLSGAVRWATVARAHSHISTSKAYGMSLSLLALFLTLHPTMQMQHELLNDRNGYSALAQDAASYAIETGKLEEAVEILERGRALLWSQMRSFRTPQEQLAGVNKELVDAFVNISNELEALATSSETRFTRLDKPGAANTRPGPQFFNQMLNRTQALRSKLEVTITEIRKTPGFENFLRATPFSMLKDAAIEGPVIIINHSRYRSDALIIHYDCPPICVPLADNFYEDALDLYVQLANTRQSLGIAQSQFDSTLWSVMKDLWKLVVSPVISQLNIEEQSQIWWCPTSIVSALPLHAAGPISPGSNKYLLDKYVSSYMPTLTVLIRAQSSTARISEQSSLLLISQPGPSMPNVAEEVRVIRELNASVTSLIGDQASCDAVLEGLKNHDWAHLSCHGSLKPFEPFTSSFILFGNERLTLLDIAKSNLPNAELAFLSACHSTEQTISCVQDEVLHLSAAMQFCSFRSIVGTMWAMADIDGPDLTKDFYEKMFAEMDQTEAGYKRSARALCKAVKWMRKKKGMSFERWVNFVHVGA